jgi:hypothetical protein
MKSKRLIALMTTLVLVVGFSGTAQAFGGTMHSRGILAEVSGDDPFLGRPFPDGDKVVVEVAPGESIQQALDDNPGATIRLLAGRHEVSDTLIVGSGQVIEGEGGKVKSGSLVTTLASSAPVAINTETTEAVTFRDLNIEAQAQGIVHNGAGDLTIDNCRVASAQDPALPESAEGRAVVIVNVFPSFSPPERGGVITIRRSEIVAGSENAGPGDRDAIGVFGFFNQASWKRIEVTESRLMTRQREGDQSAFAVGFEMLGMANADAEIVLRDNEISTSGYGIQIVGFGGTATVEKNLIATDGGGIMYSSRSDNPGLIANNEIAVTGEVGRGLPDFPEVFWPTACLLLGPSPAGFIGPELAGNGVTGLVVEKNDLNCGAPGVLMATLTTFNTDPAVENGSSRNAFVKNDFNISGPESHVILGSETSDNWFVDNKGLRFDKVQDDGTNNRFD